MYIGSRIRSKNVLLHLKLLNCMTYVEDQVMGNIHIIEIGFVLIISTYEITCISYEKLVLVTLIDYDGDEAFEQSFGLMIRYIKRYLKSSIGRGVGEYKYKVFGWTFYISSGFVWIKSGLRLHFGIIFCG